MDKDPEWFLTLFIFSVITMSGVFAWVMFEWILASVSVVFG